MWNNLDILCSHLVLSGSSPHISIKGCQLTWIQVNWLLKPTDFWVATVLCKFFALIFQQNNEIKRKSYNNKASMPLYTKKTVKEFIGAKLRKENKKVLSFLASFESIFPFFSLWKYQKTLRVEKENIGSKLVA